MDEDIMMKPITPCAALSCFKGQMIIEIQKKSRTLKGYPCVTMYTDQELFKSVWSPGVPAHY